MTSLKYLKLLLLVVSIGFLLYGLNHNLSIPETFASHDHIPTFSSNAFVASSSSTIVLRPEYVPKDTIIQQDIHSNTSIQIRASHIDNLISKIPKSDENSPGSRNNDMHGIAKQIKNDILQGKYFGAYKNLDKLKNIVSHLPNESSGRNLSPMIDSLQNSIREYTMPVREKLFFSAPKKLHDADIPIDLISCKPSHALILKESTGEPACVKKSTVKKLVVERAWGIEVSKYKR